MFGKIRDVLSTEKWIENFEGYLDARIELAKYDAREASVAILTKTIIYGTLGFFGLLTLICLNFALGYWISSLLGNSFGGFFVLTSFYLILFLLVYFNKSNKKILARLETAIRNAIKKMGEPEKEEGKAEDNTINT